MEKQMTQLPRWCPEHPNNEKPNMWGYTVCPICGQQLAWRDSTDYAVIAILDARKECPGCLSKADVHLMRTVQTNGKSLVYWHCDGCDRRISKSLSHPNVNRYLDYLRMRYPDREFPADVEDIRVQTDYRDGEPCFVCSRHDTGTEYHHFMPQAFKDDPRVAPNWERWEMCGVRLCRACHELWHEKVAPMHELARMKSP